MKTTWINKPTFKKMSWSHFWEYYKFHAIFGLFALILLISLLWTVFTKETTDLTVQVIGNPSIAEDMVETAFEIEVSPLLKSADNDDEFKIDAVVMSLAPYHLSKDDQSGAMKIIEWDQKPSDADVMLIERITLDLTAGEPSLYIIDGGIMQVYMSQGVFEPLENLGFEGETIEGESELDPGVTHTYGLSLKGNKFMERMGLDCENKYIGVRVINEMQKNNKTANINFDNAMTALKYIISQ